VASPLAFTHGFAAKTKSTRAPNPASYAGKHLVRKRALKAARTSI